MNCDSVIALCDTVSLDPATATECCPSVIQTFGSEMFDFLTKKTGFAVGMGCVIAFAVYLVKQHGSRIAAKCFEKAIECCRSKVVEARNVGHEGFSNPSTGASSQAFTENAHSMSSVNLTRVIDVEEAVKAHFVENTELIHVETTDEI